MCVREDRLLHRERHVVGDEREHRQDEPDNQEADDPENHADNGSRSLAQPGFDLLQFPGQLLSPSEPWLSQDYSSFTR